MILGNSIEALIESVYLEQKVCRKIGESLIHVNPTGSISYIVGKTCILNNTITTESEIKTLRDNGNKIISRINRPGLMEGELFPYITRVSFKAMWNGETITCPNDIKGDLVAIGKWLWEDNDLSSYPASTLYFPKIINIDRKVLVDQDDNLSALGWILHQVGINLDNKTDYIDLDLLKTKKLGWK